MDNRSDFFNSEREIVQTSKRVINQDVKVQKAVGRTSLFLIGYYIIMAIGTVVAMMIAIMKKGEYLEVTSLQSSEVLQTYTDALMLGLLFSTFIGVILFLYLEKDSNLMRVLKERHGKMTPKYLVQFAVLLMAVQIIFSVLSTFVEWVLNLCGISMMQSIEAASLEGYSLPIILYAGIIGPITEEVIFRGAILHYLQKYGRWFALVMSSLLFGLFHANIPQGVFAFFIGGIFAYVTYKYSIKWAIVLHIFNNLILNILLTAIVDITQLSMIEMIQTVVFVGAFIYTAIIIWQNKVQIKGNIHEWKRDNASFRDAFSSVALWILIILLGITALSMLISI